MIESRKLATIRKISEINEIKDASNIEVATVGGWKVVVRKGEYQVNDLVVYLEIDSFVPNSIAPFLTKSDRSPSEYKDIKGERLRTVKLRGQISQGLILSLDDNIMSLFEKDGGSYYEGDDVSHVLGIVKWEPPIDASLAGQVKGNFPSFIQKTDQERCIHEGTLVDTDKGLIKIEELCTFPEDYQVVTLNHDIGVVEYNQISAVSIASETTEWLEITTESGHVLYVTENHKIYIENLFCYTDASNIVVGDEVLIFA